MHGVLRRYNHSSMLSDALMKQRGEVEELLRGVPGFITYAALRDGDRLITITICEDQMGTQESTRRAAGWVKENLSSAQMSTPEVTEGEVILQFDRNPVAVSD